MPYSEADLVNLYFKHVNVPMLEGRPAKGICSQPNNNKKSETGGGQG